MFGTLVVCLPCHHDGGDVLVSFNGKKQTLNTSATSEWFVSYLAWYADVLHEVTPVRSGYRVVLTYNLVYVGAGAPPNLAVMETQMAGLRSDLKLWKSASRWGHDVPTHLVYLLEHKYTEANLKLSALKKNDLARAQCLQGLSRELDLVCYLATVERMVDGDCDGYGYGMSHDIDEENDSTITLKHVAQLDGQVFGKDVDLEPNNIVQTNPWDDRDPDDEDHEGYTGNEAATTTYWYRDSVGVTLSFPDSQADLSVGTRLHAFRARGPVQIELP